MNAIAETNRPEAGAPDLSEHEQHICRRVLDTLLRENVRGCVSQSARLPSAALPARHAGHAMMTDTWLHVSHFGPGSLWIPVTPAGFMQDWKSAGLPWLWQEGSRMTELHALEQILDCFAQGLAAEEASLFEAFVGECTLAVSHRARCESERERWFGDWRASHAGATGADLPDWHARLLHYDRLAAFLDHPFYPTARAKLGFDDAALAGYSPEFQVPFQLRWLAVPNVLHHPSAERDRGLPALWPQMEHVGLPATLAATHVLMPVHPFVWENQLDTYLSESGLREQAIRAPRPYLSVAPTLSVRTVVLLDAPEWHLKLPLTMRTLGAKNIRTIKPSTIGDGHRIQTLLGQIVLREPMLAGRVLLTDEECGAHVDHRVFLGYILRRYPSAALEDSTLIPVAALMAPTPGRKLVAEEAGGTASWR
ncbi:IucA/IucC family protein [Massilia cavernae]|uniref:IucA/IucC family protein n=1 Tax=Massilia cavernae TaxID=2320864 RepID=UPI001C72603A|nr:IucA/IucC family protein [Massilia cavernae]